MRKRMILISLAGILFFQLTDSRPSFQEMKFNSRWYRTFDSTSDILPEEGGLLFNWQFSDPEQQPDSFYVGIDTLWALPQNVDGDTAADWDLQVCPDQICMNGLKAGVHGANAAYPFEKSHFETEHHFQFFPAINGKSFKFFSPPNALFGAMMFCRSRTTGMTDTILGFGAWGLAWDSLHAPPVRPIDGYLPKLDDFAIVGDTVRYLKGSSGVTDRKKARRSTREIATLKTTNKGLTIFFQEGIGPKRIEMYDLKGNQIWSSGVLPNSIADYFISRESLPREANRRCAIFRIAWSKGGETKILPAIFP